MSDNGGPAFPFVTDAHLDNGYGGRERIPSRPQVIHGGMTLRDYFAGQALAGLLADPNEVPESDEDPLAFQRVIAGVSYDFADAMLAERNART